MTTAAEDLKIHRVEDTAGGGYEPHEPFYYLLGGEIPALEEIPASNYSTDAILTGHDRKEKHLPRKQEILEDLLEEEMLRLGDRKKRWEKILAQGLDAVSRHDLENTSTSNPGLALCSALALAYNNVSTSRGKIFVIVAMLEAVSISRQIQEDPLLKLPISREKLRLEPEGEFLDYNIKTGGDK